MTDATNNATFTLSDKTLEFATGTIKLSNGVDLTAGTGNGAITIHSLEGTSHEDLSLTSTGTIKPGTIGATLAKGINDITINGPTTLTGNITAASDGTADAGLVNFNGAVIVDGDITVDTDRVAADGAGTTADANDGAITFGSTILAEGTDTDKLTVQSGSGALTFSGAIGGTTGKSLDGFDVNQSGGSAAITMPIIGATNASFAGTSGITRIGNSDTTSITLS